MCRQLSLTSKFRFCISRPTAAMIVVLGAVTVSINAQEPPKSDQPPQVAVHTADNSIEQLRKLVGRLTAEVARLRTENAKLEKYRQMDYLRAQLLKEEQRVEALQRESANLSAKEASLQKRLDEIEPEMRRDRIEQSRAGVGSTKPEEDRNAIQRQLVNEQRLIQNQIDQLQQNRSRLQNAVTTAEASIATLRQRLRDAVRAAGLSD